MAKRHGVACAKRTYTEAKAGVWFCKDGFGGLHAPMHALSSPSSAPLMPMSPERADRSCSTHTKHVAILRPVSQLTKQYQVT